MRSILGHCRNILLRGKVSWISYEGGKTALIINLHGYNREHVAVYYQGRLPAEYMGTDVAVYGIAKGRNIIKNIRTGHIHHIKSHSGCRIKVSGNGESWDMGSGNP